MLFREFISQWKAKARNKPSKSWKIGQDQVLKDHVLPHLGHIQLKSITPSNISDVLLASKNKGHSNNQQKKIYMVMSKVFGDAIHFFDYIEKSPVRKAFHLPEKEKPVERAFLSYEQALVFLEYTMHDKDHGIASWIMTLSGLRISELQALEWTDIDFKNECIRVTKSYCNTTGEFRDHTKNKNDYDAPLSPMLKAFLWNKKEPSGRVCPGLDGEAYSRFRFRDHMKRVNKKLHFPVASSHGLRHTCARIYVELGASDEQISELLGHKHIISAKTYVHRKGVSRLKQLSKKIA